MSSSESRIGLVSVSDEIMLSSSGVAVSIVFRARNWSNKLRFLYLHVNGLGFQDIFNGRTQVRPGTHRVKWLNSYKKHCFFWKTFIVHAHIFFSLNKNKFCLNVQSTVLQSKRKHDVSLCLYV